MAIAHDYYLSVIGKSFDEDGVYGTQCVDGFKHFCRTVLGYNISNKSICSPTGYAHSIWDNFDSLGLGNYFDKVSASNLQDGDWCIWAKGSAPCPSSHIAMFRLDNGNGTGIFLGQNQISSNAAYTQINISYSGIRGGLRPKIYHQTTYTTGNYKTLYNMNVRSGAGTSYACKKVSELTADGKANATSTNANDNAVYKAGTIFTAKEIITNSDGSIWARSPSGYICIKDNSQTYCEKQ